MMGGVGFVYQTEEYGTAAGPEETDFRITAAHAVGRRLPGNPNTNCVRAERSLNGPKRTIRVKEKHRTKAERTKGHAP